MTFAGFSAQAKSVIATVAPLLGTALGGPLGGTAGTLIAKALGGGDPKAAEAALIAGDPQTLLALTKVQDDFKAHMSELGIEEQQIRAGDIASARQREIAVKDHTPAILAYLVTAGFFSVLGYVMHVGLKQIGASAGGEAVLIMLGSLGTAWTGIIGYYFGSSIGSKEKDKALSDIARS